MTAFLPFLVAAEMMTVVAQSGFHVFLPEQHMQQQQKQRTILALLTFFCPASPRFLPDSWTHPTRVRCVRLPDADAVPSRFREGFGA